MFRDLVHNIVSDSKNQRAIIEAFGTPGVGKSYVCSGVQHQYIKDHGAISYHSIDDYHKNIFFRLLQKISVILMGLVFSPSIVKLNFLMMMRFRKIKGLVKLKLFLNLLLISSVIVIHRSQNKPLLLDQGIFQALWSCYYYNNEAKCLTPGLVNIIDSLLDKLVLTNLLIFHISSDKAIILSRLENRRVKGSSPLNSFEDSIIDRGIFATAAIRNLILKLADNSGKVKVFEVKN